MSVRKILKSRILSHTKSGIKNAKEDQATALEMLIRIEECKSILKEINKRR